MCIVKFILEHESEETPVKEFKTLKECFCFIRKELNVPQNWTVNEMDGNEIVDFASANFLIHNYTEETLPRTLSEIPHY